MYKLPERPYDVGQEDNVEENNEEDRDSEEPGMALEIYLDILGLLLVYIGMNSSIFVYINGLSP